MLRCIKIHKYLILILTLVVIPWLAVGDNAMADNIRPAYLDIEEFESGAFRVVWKVPLNQNVPARFRPSFPEAFKASSPKKRIKTPNAVIQKWTMVCDKGKFAGATIGIEGLEETTTDALVRIQLADGTLHRTVLRPTERSTTVPTLAPAVIQQEGGVRSVLQLANRWGYVLLFLAACTAKVVSTASSKNSNDFFIVAPFSEVAGSLKRESRTINRRL